MKRFDGLLLLTDLDGTLLNREGRISGENLTAIRSFIQQGGRFSVATGRSKAGMEHFLEELPINAPAVIYNGAVVYDFQVDHVVWQQPLGERGVELARFVCRHFPRAGIEAYELHTPYVIQENAITRRHFSYVKMPWREAAAEQVPQPWINMLITEEPEPLEKIRRAVAAQFPGQYFLQYSSPHYLEVLHPAANKGAGALALCTDMGIEKTCLYTVGDGRNDVQLISCTPNGFAPQNADPEVLGLCAGHLPDHDHHAIAALIQILEQTLV